MLTGKQKSYLKGLAHTMQPIIQVGIRSARIS